MPGTRRRLAAALLGAAFAAASLTLAAGASAGPAARLASFIAAAEKEASVHYVAASRDRGTSIVQVADVGVSAGIQRITYSTGGKTGHLTVIVTTEGVFAYGDSFALSRYLGFPSATAVRDGDHWLFVTPANPAYASLAAAVTLPSFMLELELKAPLSDVAATTIAGVRAVGVEGKDTLTNGAPLEATLYARASGSPLPLKEIVHDGKASITVILSKWNESFHFRTPVVTEPAPKKPAAPAKTLPPGLTA